ncbi:hypothetical protein RCH11_000318 [Glaciihabitans sp. GrIS 2.15]|nr:hypothetical protein [Glaciihabitans sp. GrIS 2.15]
MRLASVRKVLQFVDVAWEVSIHVPWPTVESSRGISQMSSVPMTIDTHTGK